MRVKSTDPEGFAMEFNLFGLLRPGGLFSRLAELRAGTPRLDTEVAARLEQLGQKAEFLQDENEYLKQTVIRQNEALRRHEADSAQVEKLKSLVPLAKNLKTEVLDLRARNAALSNELERLNRELEKKNFLLENVDEGGRVDLGKVQEKLDLFKKENSFLRSRFDQQEQHIKFLKGFEAKYKNLRQRMAHIPATPDGKSRLHQ